MKSSLTLTTIVMYWDMWEMFETDESSIKMCMVGSFDMEI